MAKSEITKIKLDKGKRNVRMKAGGLLQALLALAFLALGIIGVYLFITLRKPPQKVEQEVLAPLVKVQQLRKRDIQMVVSGYGSVNAQVQTDIVSEVSGKVVVMNPQLKTGGFIPAEEQILKIDPRDYELAVQQAQALVADAQVKLEIEVSEAEVAKKEWQGLHPDTEPTSLLVLREPQIKKAQAALASAKAQLATAELRLERTSVSLPFDALIISEKADLGQYVVAGQSVGVAYGTGAVEIEVPLEDKELAWFNVFANSMAIDVNENTYKTNASVKAEFAGSEHIWDGFVVRTTGQVDRMSRMVSVVVEVMNPFDTSRGRPPLLPGAFVEVFIEGRTLKDVVAVPRDALHEGNKVWLVNDGCLHIQPLEILRSDKTFAYTRSGIDDKAMIITSSLDTAIDGMKVRMKIEDTNEVPGQSSGIGQENAQEIN
jgi:multidrug efflux system membrane fusion protein